MNTITCCDNTVTADVTGERVGRLREHLRDALSIPVAAVAFLNTVAVPDDAVIPPAADLEFAKVSGRKGMGQVWTPDEFCRHCKITRDELDLWVQQGLPVLPLNGGDFRIAEAAFEEHVRVQYTLARRRTGAVVGEGGGLGQAPSPRPHPSTPPATGAGDRRPRWVAEERKLYVGKTLVKHFVQPADNQEAVLEEFERRGWPRRIDNPLPPDPQVNRKRQRRDTVESLNRNHAGQAVLRFESDGSGGIRWRVADPGIR